MSNTRYGRDIPGGGNQDQGERKDEGWESRQGGRESNEPGRRGSLQPADTPGSDRESLPPPGTNTQGHLAGIGEASEETLAELPPKWREHGVSEEVDEMAIEKARNAERDEAESGTDQPRRMGGPLGPDPDDPHLPGGAQNADTRGTGTRGFDVGVDASNVGAVHQGVRPEEHDDV
jgi:hypothetical protein